MRISRLITTALALSAVSAVGEVRFNRDIRPILSDNCFACHGTDANKVEAGLQLHSVETAMVPLGKKGDRRAIVPGDRAASELWARISSKDPDEQMPPADSNHKLTAAQITLLGSWIDEGAKYEGHWAFQPVVRVEASSIDALIRTRLEGSGLHPSPSADKRTLLRRLSQDLTGLPPTSEEIAAFLADSSPGAYARQVERLLAAPASAERLALDWLDGARYADTNGYSIDDHRDMWIWRDWVIHAFLTNKPFDQFALEQIAGDLLPMAIEGQRVATGFLRNSMNTHEGGTIAEEYRVTYNVDKVDTVSTVFMGLTMKCAQCHDHKYDPISQKEFYQFYAFFNASSEPGNGATNANTGPLIEAGSPICSPERVKRDVALRLADLERLKARPPARMAAQRDLWEALCRKEPQAGDASALHSALATQRSERSPVQWATINAEFAKSAPRFKTLTNQLALEEKILRKTADSGRATVMVMDHKPRKTHILIRGAYDKPGVEVTAGTPSTLPPMGAGNPDGKRTRLDLARWLVDPKHPLTSRVIVNRYWQMLFGAGLVKTAEDFGAQGEYPSHPELLDFLAAEFVASGWNLRGLLRQIVMSKTYQLVSTSTPELLEKDPYNRLLARAPRFRLAAEFVRDGALAVGDLLNRDIGGPSVHPYQPDGLWEEVSHYGYPKPFSSQKFLPGSGRALYRRSMYTAWKRTSPPPSMAIFDAPSRETCSVRRLSTNTPLQALVLQNDPQFLEAARSLGEAMAAAGSVERGIALGAERVLGRAPSDRESKLLTAAHFRYRKTYENQAAEAGALLAAAGAMRSGDDGAAESAAWTLVASTLLNMDEAVTRQ